MRANNDLETKNKKFEEPQVKWLDIVTRTMAVFIAESRCDCHPFSWILQQSLIGGGTRVVHSSECFGFPDLANLRNNSSIVNSFHFNLISSHWWVDCCSSWLILSQTDLVESDKKGVKPCLSPLLRPVSSLKADHGIVDMTRDPG